MSSSAATRSEVAALSADAGAEVAALSGDAGMEVVATSGDAGAGSDGGRAWRGADEGTARARFCKRRRCSAPLICCADRSSRLIQVRPRLGRGQGGARAGPGLGPGQGWVRSHRAEAGTHTPSSVAPATSLLAPAASLLGTMSRCSCDARRTRSDEGAARGACRLAAGCISSCSSSCHG